MNFIFGRSPEARRLFVRFLAHAGPRLADDLTFSTQAADADGTIPDLVGRDATGAETLIAEAKFWAGLTDRQPVQYLTRLPTDGLLVFIAPALRFESLWPELLTRCRQADHAVDEVPGGGRRLALTSWRAVLETLHAGLLVAGEVATAADVFQLRGLADRMDADAFLPLASEELTSATGRRIVQFCRLVDAVISRLKTELGINTDGTRASADSTGSYFRPFRTGSLGCEVIFTTEGWAVRGMPFTVRIRDQGWKESKPLAEYLAKLPTGTAPGLIVTPWGGVFHIRPPLGVERDAVIESLVEQILPLAAVAAGWTPPTVGPPSGGVVGGGERSSPAHHSPATIPLGSFPFSGESA